MMKYLAILLALVAGSRAFSTTPSAFGVRIKQDRGGALYAYYSPDKLERAVECSEHYDLCDVDELLRLADELVQFEGCIFEEDPEACKKEELDRHDVADILRLQSELKLRQNYLKHANLFTDDVTKARLVRERDELLEAMANFQSW